MPDPLFLLCAALLMHEFMHMHIRAYARIGCCECCAQVARTKVCTSQLGARGATASSCGEYITRLESNEVPLRSGYDVVTVLEHNQ